MPHQRDAARTLATVLDTYGITLLADPVGTGKTYVALAVARRYAAVTIVAPAALRSMWERAATDAGVRINVVTHEQLSRTTERVAQRGALIVVDEAHHARSSTSRRYRALATLTWGQDVLLLSATPLHNRERDLQNVFALGLGSRALSLPVAWLARLTVRREELALGLELPGHGDRQWVAVTHAPAVLDAILALPPPVGTASAGRAVALGTLGLVRQWCSSDAALAAAIDRRLTQSAAVAHCLERGERPARDRIASMVTPWGDVQLSLGLDHLPAAPQATTVELHQVQAHINALRALRARLGAADVLDAPRTFALDEIVRRHYPHQVVLFSHSADTARAAFGALAHSYRCALLHGRGARVSSGPVSRDWVLDRFRMSPGAPTGRNATAVHLLIATDVVSEGVNLQSAAVVIHLDLPWTAARLEQRLGRIRRLGSRHRLVHEYALGPPANAERVTGIMRRLLRKAGLATRVTGVAWMFGPRRCATPGRHPLVNAAFTHRLRDFTEPWLSGSAGHEFAPAECPVIAAVRAPVCRSEFVALVDTGEREQLLASSGEDVTPEPEVIFSRLKRCAGEETEASEASAHLALHRLHRWLVRSSAERQLFRSSSTAHRQTLLVCVRELTPGRLNRRLASQRLERIRALLQGTRGIGGELFLSDWCRRMGERCPSAADLAELEATLSPRIRRTHDGVPRVLALLLLVGDHADHAEGLIHSRDDLSRGALRPGRNSRRLD
jgi:superfamily II DNA or RNA helicase